METLVLGILVGVLAGLVIGLGMILRITNQDLAGVRRRYIEQHEELAQERNRNRLQTDIYLSELGKTYDRLILRGEGQAKEIVSEVTTGIAMVLNGLPGGPQVEDHKQEKNVEGVGSDWQFDEDVPRDRQGNRIEDKVQWIPEIELDPEMAMGLGERPPGESPVMGPGTWTAQTPVQPQSDEGPEYVIANGKPIRKDRQTMFRPGTSAEPPTSGIE